MRWEVCRGRKNLELLRLSCDSSNSYASFVLSELPAVLHISTYAQQNREPIVF